METAQCNKLIHLTRLLMQLFRFLLIPLQPHQNLTLISFQYFFFTTLFALLSQGDQLAIAKETGRRLGMGSNMYPSSSLLGENKNGLDASLQIDELIENADGFAGIFPGNVGYELALQFANVLCIASI